MERDVQYCTTEDGVSIAYCVTGDGPPLLACPLLIESFMLDHMVPMYERFIEALGRNRRLIRFDMRGTGLSDHEVTDFSLEALIRDVDAVVTASGVDSVDVWAPVGSVMRAIGYAVQRPERVRHLVLHQAHASGRDVFPPEAVTGFAAMARSNWRAAAHATAGSNGWGPEAAGGVHAVGEWNRKSATGYSFANFIEAMTETSVADLLPLIAVPTLLVHYESDRLVRVEVAQKVAAHIERSRMRVLGGEGLFFTNEDRIREVTETVERFLNEDGRPAATAKSASPFRTVLFTDLVGHTEMMQRLGDAKGRDVLREHERITREMLKLHGGVELKTDGDSFMVSFASVTAALDCAVALQRAFAQHNEASPEAISVRMGLNAGEPIEEEGDLFGSSVILAARIAAQAGAGEILIPEPVRHLLSGKNFVYADRGETVLKGFEDTVRLYEVRWQE
jgi:class 3 adenylate cyclase